MIVQNRLFQTNGRGKSRIRQRKRCCLYCSAFLPGTVKHARGFNNGFFGKRVVSDVPVTGLLSAVGRQEISPGLLVVVGKGRGKDSTGLLGATFDGLTTNR